MLLNFPIQHAYDLKKEFIYDTPYFWENVKEVLRFAKIKIIFIWRITLI